MVEPVSACDPGSMGTPSTLRVVLVDDEEPVRALLGITLGLQPGQHFMVVGEAIDGNQAIEVCGRTHPDCVVLDLLMPKMGGLEAIPLIRLCSPESKIVVFSALAAEQMAAEAMAQGAHAYIEKSHFMSELPDTLDKVCASAA